jgi:endonuclease/exonuclease/phosphatase (EEP) superfamily protein YafD
VGEPSEPAKRLSVAGLIEAVALTTAAASVAGHFGKLSWALDLCSHFRLQYFVVGAALCALLVRLRRRRIAAVVGLTAAVDLLSVAPLYTASVPVARRDAAPLRVLLLNVHAESRAYDEVTRYLGASDADVIVVLEASAPWIAALKTLDEPYRMAIADPAVGNFGIAALTRVVLEHAYIVELSPHGYPSVELGLRRGHQLWTILGTHPPPPVGGELSQARDVQLDNIGRWARDQPGPHVVVGDLNATPFCHPFAQLLERASLTDSELGHGYQASWPYGSSALAPLRIPIDHALVSDALTVTERELGPSVGSDHRPLTVTIVDRL